jgi:phytoene dehydrogenase-like protein
MLAPPRAPSQREIDSLYDVAIVGGGLSGFVAAALLQGRGYSTILFEAHTTPGGCAGYYRRQQFSFDVGATTLVDFGPEGVGGTLLRELEEAQASRGHASREGPEKGADPDWNGLLERLPGYLAWLPDRTVRLDGDRARWVRERRALGDTPAHRRFWDRVDTIAQVFWTATRRGARLPVAGVSDVLRNAAALPWRGVPLLRHLSWTVEDLLRHCRLERDRPLRGLLAMVVEDTVHASLERAPLINAALGITMRGAGLYRPRGGMRQFWIRLVARYRALGGELRLATGVERIEGRRGEFWLHTKRGRCGARQVVSSLPIEVTERIAPPDVRAALAGSVERDRMARGGALLICLGVPEHEVSGQELTHHQVLEDYHRPLGLGNNLFLSASSPGDLASAPEGWRAVMISTHCDLEPWQDLSSEEYARRKSAAGERLLAIARKVHPNLGRSARVLEFATPVTYGRFTGRPRGAVGGVRADPSRSNQRAVSQRTGVPGFHLAGDTTWPGLGTVACVVSGRAAADLACATAPPVCRARETVE